MAGPHDVPDATTIMNEPCVHKASHKQQLAEAPRNTTNKQNQTTNSLVDSAIAEEPTEPSPTPTPLPTTQMGSAEVVDLTTDNHNDSHKFSHHFKFQYWLLQDCAADHKGFQHSSSLLFTFLWIHPEGRTYDGDGRLSTCSLSCAFCEGQNHMMKKPWSWSHKTHGHSTGNYNHHFIVAHKAVWWDAREKDHKALGKEIKAEGQTRLDFTAMSS